MKSGAMRAAVAALLVLAAGLPAARAQKAVSFYAAMKANPKLSVMANFISGQTQAALSNPALAAYTVFAPTNDAFQRMLNVKIPGIDVRSFMNNKAILQMVMNIHLVPGAWTTGKMYNGQKLQSRLTGASGMLTVEKKGPDVFIKSAGTSPKIIQANIMAGQNGVLQVIDGMLIPIKLSAAAALGKRH